LPPVEIPSIESHAVSVYRVELDFFRGPLDLLLYLVRRDELDVRELAIGPLTKQFLIFIDVLEFLDLDMVGDFVLMASTLAEIKSRLVLPDPEGEPESEEVLADDDPRTDLIKQLLEYRKYKQAASVLEEHAAEWQERYPRLSNDRPQIGNEPAADLIKEVELWDLVSALARVIEKKVIDEESSIRDDDTPISVYVERIGNQVRSEKRVAFTSLFDHANQKSRIIGIFLAILELLRHHAFRAEQQDDFGEIWVLPPLREGLPGRNLEDSEAEGGDSSKID
jgi:segregation and condensation protein A